MGLKAVDIHRQEGENVKHLFDFNMSFLLGEIFFKNLLIYF